MLMLLCWLGLVGLAVCNVAFLCHNARMFVRCHGLRQALEAERDRQYLLRPSDEGIDSSIRRYVMQWLHRLPITTETCWKLMVAVSQLSDVEQEALLDALTAGQHLTPDDQEWLRGHGLTLEEMP